MSQEIKTNESFLFNANIELMRSSPAGLVRCAADWLACSKSSYGFDAKDERFAAANRAFAAAPDIFVGAGGDPWIESSRPMFWRLFFEARAQGCPVTDLKTALADLPKAILALGAKDMLIGAARAKDAASFGELLDMGAARRSKLVMFSAYQNGGKKVALQVKAPTALEAVEMLDNGGGGWHASRAMVHDAEGFLWLLALSGAPIKAMTVARIIGNSADPASFEAAVREKVRRMSFAPGREYIHHMGMQIERTEAQEVQLAILAMASSGAPQAAKALALAKGGDGLWSQACKEGFAGVFMLPAREASVQSRLVDVHVGASDGKKDFNLQAFSTAQHAVALSRHAEACSWLRSEYDALGAPWLPAQELVKAYKVLKTGRQSWSIDGARLADEAVSISEAIDLRKGLQVGKLPAERKKSRSL